MFVAASIWGVYWIPLRAIEAAGLSDAWSVTMLNFSPLLVLIPLMIWNYKSQTVNFRIALFAGFFIGIAFTCYATGLVASSVVRATMLFYLTPIWSTLIGVLWLNEQLTKGRLAAIVFGIGGVFLLLARNGNGSVPLNVGDVLAILSGVLWAVGISTIKRWPETPILMITTFQFVFSVLSSALIALFIFESNLPEPSAIKTAFPIAFAASVCVLLPMLLAIFWISKFLFPGRVGVLMMSEVLVAILSATILLPHETMAPWQWIGGVAIISACLFEVFSPPNDVVVSKVG